MKILCSKCDTEIKKNTETIISTKDMPLKKIYLCKDCFIDFVLKKGKNYENIMQ